MTIPEQAVQAAQREYWKQVKKNNWHPTCPDDEPMEAILTAAAPHMSGVKVKQLEWVDVNIKKHYEHANSPFGQYRIIHYRFNDWRWMLVVNDGAIVKGPANSRKEALAFIQSDYEKRFWAMADITAMEPSSAREQALEEAARVGDTSSEGWIKKRDVTANIKEARDYETMAIACSHVASAIRSLKSQPAPQTGGGE